MSRTPLTVLKLGGSVLKNEADLDAAVHEIYRHRRRGSQVLAVVSAWHGATDELEERAAALCPSPQGPAAHATAALLATGERASAALLALALDKAGIDAALLDASEVGPIGRGPALDATPIGFDTEGAVRALDAHGVAVLPGFVGRTERGELCLFGRGGTDLSALFVAERLGAQRVRLVKDVAGLFEWDPSRPGPPPRRFTSLSWDDALALGGRILQAKAVRFARETSLSFEVGGLAGEDATRVGDESPALLATPKPGPPLRVALAGLGAVGGGLYRSLLELPEHFHVTSVLVRSPDRLRSEPGLEELLTFDPDAFVSGDYDVLVELTGGVQPAGGWIQTALRAGKHVVTANKALLAGHGGELRRLAAERGAELYYSASVGGSVPALEAARRLRERGGLRSFEAVLGGTVNYVLDRMAEGKTMEDALEVAREAGFAEADASLDICGDDAAAKVELLAREAFGPDRPVRWNRREGIERVTTARAVSAAHAGRALRLIATCSSTEAGLVASLGVRELPSDHRLARVRDEHNAVVFDRDGDPITFVGRGAGRWPTVESVLADLFDLSRRVERARRVERLQGGAA